MSDLSLNTSSIRINKWLARHGLCSRREADEWIQAGRISVDGLICRELGMTIDPIHQRIAVDGRPLDPPGERIYILLHKPANVITTRSDPQGRKTILDLLPEEMRTAGVMPVGRLDRESEGLLILSNDGDWSQLLVHPRHQTWKEYHVTSDRMPSEYEFQRMIRGVRMDGTYTLPAKVKALKRGRDESIWRIEIREGRNRQIRRMCSRFGLEIRALKRVRIGEIRLGDLPPGSWRPLNQKEIQSISSSEI